MGKHGRKQGQLQGRRCRRGYVILWRPKASGEFSQLHTHTPIGSGGLNVANQIYNRFKSAGKALNPGDIAILDAAEYHYYQVRDDVVAVRADPD